MGPDYDSIGVVLRHGGGGLLHGEHTQLQLHGHNDVALDDKVATFIVQKILLDARAWTHCAVDIKHWRVKTKTIASVFVDGEFVTSGSFDQNEISKLNDAKGALHKLSQSIPINVGRIRWQKRNESNDKTRERNSVLGARASQPLVSFCVIIDTRIGTSYYFLLEETFISTSNQIQYETYVSYSACVGN
ncbi:hypothetical protein Q3G72_031329 [Acer saccharum]|nr:hypothetical protein Q3G72_031329 [Acer saccharum]